MADFGMGTLATGHLTVGQNWNSSTQVSYHIRLWCTTSGGAYNYGPGPTWSGNAGGVGGSGGWSYSGNGDHVVWEFDYTYNKDANGNGTWNFSGSMNGANSPYVTSGSTNFNMSPARIGIPPTWAAHSADTISVTTARLGCEISSHGLGTSSNMTMYTRILGDVSWTDWGNQGDVGGYNYWNVSGLRPGTTYQMVTNHWNNNGDYVQSPISTFTTLPAPANNQTMLRVIGVL
jgi:hypothetical protein